jgi:hypothetical protein
MNSGIKIGTGTRTLGTFVVYTSSSRLEDDSVSISALRIRRHLVEATLGRHLRFSGFEVTSFDFPISSF